VIFRRVLFALTAAATLAAAAGVIVVALAFALYALTEPYLGRAGAAGAVALVTAFLIGLVGLVLAILGRERRSRVVAPPSGGVLERTVAFLSQRPVMSAAAALGAGLIAARNPKYLGEALRAFVQGGAFPK